MLSTASALPLRTLALGFAPSALGEFVQDFDQVFAGLTPFLLFAGPVVVLLFRHRPLVWLISSSTVAYLAVMSVPLLAFPYVYLTYLRDSSRSNSQCHLLRLSACGDVRLCNSGRSHRHRSHSPAAACCGSRRWRAGAACDTLPQSESRRFRGAVDGGLRFDFPFGHGSAAVTHDQCARRNSGPYWIDRTVRDVAGPSTRCADSRGQCAVDVGTARCASCGAGTSVRIDER